MIIAPIPENEQERLQALEKYQILDTDFEKEYHDVIKLASQICETPISLMSLIDSERQWFKAENGFGLQETHRDQAFCAHAIHDNEIFTIPDATKDERFVDNPLVTGSTNVRFYAGKPLTTPDGYNIGTLCVLDTVPRELTPEQEFALDTLATQIITHLELRIKIFEMKQMNQKLEDEKQKLAQTLDELERTQSQMLETEKMASLGNLTAGLANEINNPLNFIYPSTELLQQNVTQIIKIIHDFEQAKTQEQLAQVQQKLTDLKEELEIDDFTTENEELFEAILKGSKRIQEIVKSLRIFCRLDEDEAKFASIKENLEACILLTQRDFGNVEFDFDFAPKLPQVEGFHGELNQVFMAVLTNAKEAISESAGKITIRTCQENEFAHIDIIDTGCGISPNVKTNIFEPFFTTKDTTHKGLGLSVAYGIIQKHHGKICIESSNQGTKVSITLPFNYS